MAASILVVSIIPNPFVDAIGIVGETGHPKEGKHTAGVKRQWCGNTGKVDNCVVSVHTGYVAGDFHCLPDSDVYLPKLGRRNRSERPWFVLKARGHPVIRGEVVRNPLRARP